jgi:hypothetical protein
MNTRDQGSKMKIRVLSVESQSFVVFCCQAGEATGVWRSTKCVPLAGQGYEVEIDTSAVLGDDAIARGAVRGNRLERVGSKTRLNATVEQVDEDGIAYLRLAPDCLILAETEASGIKPGVMTSLSLEPAELQISVIGTAL